MLKYIAEEETPVVLFESTHRIMKLLKELAEHVPGRKVTLARELTKMYEEVLVGMPEELRALLTATPEKQRGEFVVIVG